MFRKRYGGRKWISLGICLGMAGAMLTACQDEPKRMGLEQMSQKETYSNPMELAEEWEDYGIGDPFVMRYNGMYYLYCSTQDSEIGVKAWSSPDLAHWKAEGLVTDDPLTKAAYAPEVVYWNGYFYMYTSPGGGGHYVLRSESPTGPFTVQTDNMGMSIDGSVFIDDDGKWYFTHASDRGIVANEMTDPLTFGEGTLLSDVFLQHWTEGSMLIKRKGKYIMTYTGNHVFSTGYRINYAVSDKGPLGPYRTPENNPFVISTADEFNGLGHSSTVLGPDLDSYYLIYHNLVGASTSGPPVRKLNIDRLQFNGERMSLLGPTYAMNRPSAGMPDFAVREVRTEGTDGWKKEQGKDAQLIVAEAKTAAAFTAEFNVHAAAGAGAGERFGAVFSYKNEKNYMEVEVDPAANTLSIVEAQSGRRTELSQAELPVGTDYSKLHTIRVENGEGKLHVYWDQMHKAEAPKQAAAGRIGYAYAASAASAPAMLYTAFSNEEGGSSDAETAKPIPGRIEAVHYLQDRKRGYLLSGSAAASAGERTAETRGQLTDDGSYAMPLDKAGDWLAYRVQVKMSGTYGLDVDMLPGDADTIIEIDTGSGKQQFTLPKRGDGKSSWKRVRLGSIALQEGFADLKLTVLQGALTFRSLEFYPGGEPFASIDNVPKSMVGMWVPADGADGGYATRAHEYIKTFAGDEGWTDYRMEAEFHFDSVPYYNAGLIFRSVNESFYPHQVPDAFTGYYASVGSEGLELKKVNYGVQQTLQSVPLPIQAGTSYRLAVEVIGSRIKLYWNDQPQPVIDFEDARAYTHGKIGLLSDRSDIHFRQVRVTQTK